MKIRLIFEKDKDSNSLMKLKMDDLVILVTEKDLKNLVDELYNKREDLFEDYFDRRALKIKNDILKEKIEELEEENQNLRDEIDMYEEN